MVLERGGLGKFADGVRERRLGKVCTCNLHDLQLYHGQLKKKHYLSKLAY